MADGVRKDEEFSGTKEVEERHRINEANLDGWMCGREVVLAAVARHAADADVAIVEGVMGCFDGVDGTSDAGSTARRPRGSSPPCSAWVRRSPGQAASSGGRSCPPTRAWTRTCCRSLSSW